MDAERRLSQAFLEAHPEDAARRLERLPAADTAAFLEEVPVAAAATLLAQMVPATGAECLAQLTPKRAGSLLSYLSLDTAAGLLRRLPDETSERLLTSAALDTSSALALLLRFPEDTAGALMDPRVLAVPEDINVREARLRVRRAAQHVFYYLYVVDRNHRLVGVLNLRELMLVPGKEPLTSVMCPHVARLNVQADRLAILNHPGWRTFHALPVVDENDVLLGALRYETLRNLEVEEQPAPVRPQGALVVTLALGELYWVAMGGLLLNLLPQRRPSDGA